MSHRIALELIQIQDPCPVSWDDMHGDERVRFCDHCSLHVYNLSAMSRDAAEKLVAEREGRMCVQLYRRTDGVVVTRDCSRLRAAAERATRFAARSTVAIFSVALFPLIYWAPATLSAGTRQALDTMESWIMKLVPVSSRVAGGMPPPPTRLAGDVSGPTTGEIAPATQPTTAPTMLLGKVSAPSRPH